MERSWRCSSTRMSRFIWSVVRQYLMRHDMHNQPWFSHHDFAKGMEDVIKIFWISSMIRYILYVANTATKMMVTRWLHLRNTLVCLPCDQHHAIAKTCDYHLSITTLDCHLTNILQKTPHFPSPDQISILRPACFPPVCHLTNMSLF